MSSSKLPSTSEDQAKDSSETDSDVDTLASPHGERNIEMSIQPGTSGESHEMKWEPTTGLPVTRPELKTPPSDKGRNLTTEEVQKVAAFLSNTKLNYRRPSAKSKSLKVLSPENKKDVSPKTRAKTSTGLKIGPKQSKAAIQNPLIKTKTNKDSSIAGPSKSKSKKNIFQLPLTKEEIAETFQLSEACRFFLTFMKTKLSDLKYKESQIDGYTIEIQKGKTDAEQVSFKLEAEPETVAKELSAAITQAQKLHYLLSISSRSYGILYKVGLLSEESLKAYIKYSDDVLESIDRLLEYIVMSMVER